MDIYKEDIRSPQYLERLAANLAKLNREFEEAELESYRECLRVNNPRVVVCHCAACGGK